MEYQKFNRGIFRAKKDFKLYSDEEQLEVCNKIRKPMIIAICIASSIIINKIFIPITCKVFEKF